MIFIAKHDVSLGINLEALSNVYCSALDSYLILCLSLYQFPKKKATAQHLKVFRSVSLTLLIRKILGKIITVIIDSKWQ